MVRKFIKITRKTKGQAMAEFALTIPVFLLLVFGIIELSRFFLVYSSVFTAVREATRYGSSVGNEGIPNYLDCSEIAETAVRTGHFGGVQTNDVSISYESVTPESDQERDLIAICPNNDSGTVPIRTDDGKKYIPGLGDRIYIEIATDYVSLLGVVPNLTVNASNGRTIMLGIQNQVAANPPSENEEDGGDDGGYEGGDDGGDEGGDDGGYEGGDDEGDNGGDDGGDDGGEDGGDGGNEGGEDGGDVVICSGDPIIVLEDYSSTNGNKVMEVTIKNYSNITYKLNNFYNLQWDKNINLEKIAWDGTELPQGKIAQPLPPGLNISIGSNNLQIGKESTQTVKFTFDGNTNKLKIKFDLIFYELDKPCPTKPITISNY